MEKTEIEVMNTDDKIRLTYWTLSLIKIFIAGIMIINISTLNPVTGKTFLEEVLQTITRLF